MSVYSHGGDDGAASSTSPLPPSTVARPRPLPEEGHVSSFESRSVSIVMVVYVHRACVAWPISRHAPTCAAPSPRPASADASTASLSPPGRVVPVTGEDLNILL